MTAARRTDAGAAVAGLFARPSATGGLATRDAPSAKENSGRTVPQIRQSVELPEDDVVFLRGLSRPDRTGQPRSLGSKFVATGVLLAAVELLREVDVDMNGVEAGDLVAMQQRARAALIQAGNRRADQEA